MRKNAEAAGIDGKSFGPHAMRATAATNALDRGADLGKVHERLGQANASATRLYDRRGSHPEDSPTFRVASYTNSTAYGVRSTSQSQRFLRRHSTATSG